MMENKMTPDPNLLFERRGTTGIVTLNRPDALNALTLGMIRGIRQILKDCRADDGISEIVFIGAGDRAFCSGGDVKAVYHAGAGIQDPDEKIALARVYFADEYRMNRELFHYPKKLVAVMDGITMGGRVWRCRAVPLSHRHAEDGFRHAGGRDRLFPRRGQHACSDPLSRPHRALSGPDGE